MTALDYILDGLEAELALARELGVRTVEIDRALLVPPSASAAVRPPPPPAPAPRPPAASASAYAFVFLHDKPLSPAGAEMMAKIVAAMGKTAATAPVVVAPPLPKAKVYIVLGGLALKRWFPGLPGGRPGRARLQLARVHPAVQDGHTGGAEDQEGYVDGDQVRAAADGRLRGRGSSEGGMR